MTGSAKRGGGRSAWVTRIGARRAGRKRVPRKSPAVARALSVRSKTSTERAMIPIQSPSSLTAYVVASRRKRGRRRGSVRRRLRIGGWAIYCIYAQVFLQMHKFRRSCATKLPGNLEVRQEQRTALRASTTTEGDRTWATVTRSF